MFENDGESTLFSYSNRTSVSGDIDLVTVIVFFGTIFLAFLIIFPGIRKEPAEAATKDNLPKKQVKCSFCGEEHFLNKCVNFKDKPFTDRKNFIIARRLCFNCLGPHQLKDCKSKFRCKICGGKHHTLLHRDDAANLAAPPDAQRETTNEASPVYQSSGSQATQSSHAGLFSGAISYQGRTGVVLGTARIIVEGPDGRRIRARALIDNCSQPSFISERLVRELELPSQTTNSSIRAVGGVETVIGRNLTRFTLKPHFNSRFACDVQALVVSRVCHYAPPRRQDISDLLYLAHLNLADPTFLDTTEIDVLLGADIHALIVQESIVRGRPNEPIATASQLGWIISGPIPLSANVTSLTSLHCCETEKLSAALQKFWEQEELPRAKYLNQEEEECVTYYNKTVRRDQEGRYVLRLPFKNPEVPKLGDSYHRATAMLKRMEAKFENDAEFKKLYREFIDDYIKSGHMTLVRKDHPLYKSPEECFFLPHHGVVKPASSTTKLRTVFNGSAKTSLNISLNDQLHTGPNLLPELPDLVCVWRLYRWVFIADIRQMYRQIKIDERDQHYQAIVWRFNPQLPIDTYYLTTVTYGLVSSPFQATKTLRHMAAEYQGQYPLAFQIITEACYMDDMLAGGHTLDQTIEKQCQLSRCLKEGGFELRKWLANEPSLLAHIPEEHLAVEPTTIFEASSSFSVLGLKWQASTDAFTFKVTFDTTPPSPTKRTVLSKVSQIFDPMGWIAPVVISAKTFMQSLWLLKCGWDKALPPEYVEQWQAWTEKLTAINSVTIPRFIHYAPDAVLCELHGFADASQKAYAAVVYLKIVVNGSAKCSLQRAKTKVAPLKTVSIPRLELLAAHTLVKLVAHFLSILPIKVHATHLWSDSKDVLFWLRGHPARWHTFVANRCSDILTLAPDAYWHYVKSADNPADVASRGIDPELLQNHPLWWNGPPWLSESFDPWPTHPDDLINHQPIEEKPTKVTLLANAVTLAHKTEDQIWDLGFRYSSLNRLLRVTAYVLRFVIRASTRAAAKRGSARFEWFPFLNVSSISDEYLTSQELKTAKVLWIWQFQQAFFGEEIKVIRQSTDRRGRKIKGALQALNPVLENELLKVGGRLDQALLPHGRKHPFILPGNCFLSELIIRDAHVQTIHGGVQTTLGAVRQEYWMINGRSAVKKVIRECKPCVRYAAKTTNQLMGDLPRSRTSPAPPFARSGVDYAGPFPIRLTKTRGKGTMKGYVCLFVCLCTRAIHLELVEDYGSEAFIAAFHRFTSRRGHCVELISDQGTNFVGADAELRKMFEKRSTHINEIGNFLTKRGTSWKFNPPGAPHFGGIWEAGVKATKYHIRRVVGEAVLTFSEMSTLLTRIEACLNSRPLLPLTDDPSDIDYLTPAHFLIHRPSFLLTEPDYTDDNVPPTKRWQLVSQKVQHFWVRWHREYLSSLQPRGKWTSRTRSYQPGDIVFIRQENMVPGHWPLARVVRTFPDKHGVNRVCELRLAKTTLKRPTVKLVLLVPTEIDKDTNIHCMEVASTHLVLLQAAP